MNLNNNFCINKISFVDNIDKDILIDTSWKYYYFRIFRIELDEITNFIYNLKDNEVYTVDPLISIDCHPENPHVNLSKTFIITNRSNPVLIANYLNTKLDIFCCDFEWENENFFLILKYKLVTLKTK